MNTKDTKKDLRVLEVSESSITPIIPGLVYFQDFDWLTHDVTKPTMYSP